MSDVRLVIRDAGRDIHANHHGSFADCVVAALAAEPETIVELDVALQRFIAPGERSFFQGFSAGVDDEPYDAGLVIVDLAARLVVCGSTYSAIGRDGHVSVHDGSSATDVKARYHLSDDWEVSSRISGWRSLADVRRRQRSAAGSLDARAVLYGDSMLEFVARQCLESFAELPRKTQGTVADNEPVAATADDDKLHDAIRRIHAVWMTSPRGDLINSSPRDAMLAQRDFITWDLQDRADQWARSGHCPRGLDEESAAFRFAGFGTHEIVTCYELVRYLLWSCCDAVRSLAPSLALGAGDFLASEMPRLRRLRDEWLDRPDPEFHGRTPRSIIRKERARLPECVSGEEAIVDHDCPLCQMQADMPGPVFWHLDGCNMDDDFAFSLHRTHEEWEAEQRDFEEFNRRFEANQAERKRLGVEYPGGGSADPDFQWERSFSAKQSPGDSPFMRLFAIGSQLGELIVDLKEPHKVRELPTDDRELIDRLCRDFGNLREIAQSGDIAMMAALFEPVLDRFCDTLDDIAADRRELEPKCSDLQDRLGRLLEPPPTEDDSTTDVDDDDPLL